MSWSQGGRQLFKSGKTYGTSHAIFGESNVVGGLRKEKNIRTYALVYLILPVAVQQKTSNSARREICSNFPVLDRFSSQDVLNRQNGHGIHVGYFLATRVRLRGGKGVTGGVNQVFLSGTRLPFVIH